MDLARPPGGAGLPGPIRARAADRPWRAGRRARLWIGVALAASVTLHLSVLALFILRLPGFGKTEPPPPATVELVMEERKGAGQDQTPPVPPPLPPAPPAPPEKQAPASPPPPQAAEQPPPPPPEPDTEPLPAPSPSAAEPAPDAKPDAQEAAAPPPAPPPPPPMPQAEPAPVLNLGGTDSPSNATVDDATNVVPASPDDRFRNRDPVYPADAARRGQQGTVQLLIHVAPDGTASSVDVTESSGVRTLDRAAHDAVAQWHFRPALRDGQPVESQFPLLIRFRIAP